ncbi:MAG: PEP-CTERM sorting domain-containing protein [Thiobacillaceae bacterium]
MNFKKTVYALALSSVGIMGAVSSVSSHAAVLLTGDSLSINPGTIVLNTAGKQKNVKISYFAMDTNGDGITGNEKVALQQGSTGIVIGATTSAGASHGGTVTGGDTNSITAPWAFFTNTGSDFVVTPITGGTSGLDFSGWRVTWNGIPSINMGGGVQVCGTNTDGICINPANSADIAGTFNNGTGVATFAWSGVYGTGYVLDYDAFVPQADPSNFGGVHYQLHLEGTVTAAPVPEASTYGMMMAGLGLVGFMASRRRKSI